MHSQPDGIRPARRNRGVPLQPVPRSATVGYLALFNTISALLRAFILVRTIHLGATSGTATVWRELHSLSRWTEAFGFVEVIHAATGLVPSSPATAALQVAGRNTISWAITRNYPDVAANGWAFSSMVIAWNTADFLRYTYFAIDKGTATAPSTLLWLRYNMFIVLYPIGILFEMWLVYEVILPSKARNTLYQYLLWLGLVLYVPGFYILYSHMFLQRHKSRRRKPKST